MKLSELSDVPSVARRLREAGFSTANVQEKSNRFADLAGRLAQEIGDDSQEVEAWWVPGRIEVFGKHTDYAGGRSVVAAAERGFCGAAVARSDAQVRIVDVLGNVEAVFPLSKDIEPTIGHWSNYPMTVARRLAANFPSIQRGASIAFASDLPPAAGMSSSSALMVMTFMLLGHLNQITNDSDFQANIHSMEELAGYLGTVENGQTFKQLVGDSGVGTFGGSEDHTAMLCAQAGQWAQFSYCPVRGERMIEAPKDHVFVIGVSGIVAEKTGAARELYNRASLRTNALTQIWQQATDRSDSHLAAIIQSSPNAFARLRNQLDVRQHDRFSRQELVDRLEQFVTENEAIIPSIPDCINSAELDRLGELTRRSQRLGAEKLGNQIPETVFLAETARRLGSVAASAQGAGFGGSVWSLVAESVAERFTREWSTAYRHAFPGAADRADFFTTRPGPSATGLRPDTDLSF